MGPRHAVEGPRPREREKAGNLLRTSKEGEQRQRRRCGGDLLLLRGIGARLAVETCTTGPANKLVSSNASTASNSHQIGLMV